MNISASRVRAWPWILVALLWVVALLNYLDREVIFSIFPLLQNELHASSVALGLTSTVFLITYGVISPFAGYAGDRFGRGRIIIASLVIWSLACGIASHVHTIVGMLWSRAGMGISEAFYIPAALAMIAETHSEKSKALATGIHQTGCYTGIILGGAIGGMAGERFGWRPLFSILGAVGMCYAIVLWIVFARLGKHDAAAGGKRELSLQPLLHSVSLKLFAIVFMAASVANWMLYTWLPLYLYERFHMSLGAAGFEATFWLQTASYAGAFLGGILADRSATRFPYGRLWVQTVGLGLACPFLLIFGHITSQAIVVLALIGVGLGRGCFDANAAPILTQLVDPKLCSTSYGILNCGGSIVGGLGALAGGWMRQRMDFSRIFQVSGISLAVGVLGLILLVEYLRRKRASMAA